MTDPAPSSAVSLPLLRLLQLVSPTLPVGAYAYSDGLESAVWLGWVGDEAGARDWILGRLSGSIAELDVPILARLYRAWQRGDRATAAAWSARLLAHRDSSETRAAERRLGRALARLLIELDLERDLATAWRDADHISFAALFALAAVSWNLSLDHTAAGYAWTFAENQVASAIKLVPLGQSAGQRILLAAGALIPDLVARGLAAGDDEIGASAPGASVASARHETLHTRLFRS